ncbi:MAG: serine/threonine protein kinase [Deltaproteobacteria bacterium]|nr:serine/threonine protein kinase [Deltaproteobacteria bacterium]
MPAPSSLQPKGVDQPTFLQRRVAKLALMVSILGGIFIVMRLALVLALRSYERLTDVSMVVHYAAVMATLVMWWACRRGRLSDAMSHGIELAGLVGSGTLYSAMGWDLPQPFRPEMTVLLALSVFLLAHAIYVPSSWKRTTVLGGALAVPLVASSWLMLVPVEPQLTQAYRASPNSIYSTPESIISVGMASVVTWWVVAVILAAVASAVIYGLRSEVSEARQLGQYTVEEKLGEGGMGIVYRANHALLRRPTAVKVLLPDRVEEADVARFEREVRATARLSHPNTVTIYDYGRTPEGHFYYAMELLEGASLAEMVDVAGPLPPERVVHVMRQVAGALAEAHDLGLIHRDIKPANVMMTSRGGVADVAKVVDFGLVKQVADGEISVTGDGDFIVGTPLFLAPEVILKQAADDGRSDLYALGCVGYFLLTGQPVFLAGTMVSVCSMHLTKEPEPPSERLGAPVPADLEALVLQLLAKDVDDRPASAAELRARLEQCECFGAWTQEHARHWWRTWSEELTVQRAAGTDEQSDLTSALTVDLLHRTPDTRTS